MLKGGLGNLMKQAQEMQDKMKEAQDNLAKLEVVGESGAGMVKVVMMGNHNVRNIRIDPSLLTDDKEIIEDLIAAAINDAVRRIDEENKGRLSDLTGGIELPAGFKFPF